MESLFIRVQEISLNPGMNTRCSPFQLFLPFCRVIFKFFPPFLVINRVMFISIFGVAKYEEISVNRNK